MENAENAKVKTAFQPPKKAKEKHEHLSNKLSDVLQSSKGELNAAVHAAVNNPLVLKAIKKLKKAKGEETLCSNDLKALNKRFMSGHLPRSKATQESFDDTDDEDEEETADPVYVPKKSTIFSKIWEYQVQLFVGIRKYVMNYTSKYGNSWLRSIIPTNQIFTLLSFLVYTYILNVEFLLYFLPVLFFSISFLVMIISTLQSLRSEKRFKEFVAWSELLVAVDSALDVNEAEDNYFRNHISPLLSLPLAIIINVMSFFVSASDFLPQSELALISVILSVVCFYSYFGTFRRISFYILGLHFAASLLESFQRISDDYGESSSWSVIIGSYKSIEIHLSLSVLLRFIALFLMICIPFQVRHRNVKAGFFRGVVPILYIMVWWEMFCLFFLGSSVFGIFRAGIGTVLLLCSLPASILLFFFALFKWLTASQILKAAILGCMIVFPIVYFRLLDRQMSMKSQFSTLIKKLGPAIKIMSVALLVVGVVLMARFYQPSGLQVRNSDLTWQDYGDVCFTDDLSPVQSRRLCYQLNGHSVNWTGTIKNIRIISIENTFESVLRYLPSSLANWLSCLYGERYRSDKAFCEESPYNSYLCLLGEKSQRECHLDLYNKYEFEIIMTHVLEDQNKSLDVKVLADNQFKKLIFLLRNGVTLRYFGLLQANFGFVKAKRLVIKDSSFRHIPRRDIERTFKMAMDESGKGLVRFFFSPFIKITETESYNS